MQPNYNMFWNMLTCPSYFLQPVIVNSPDAFHVTIDSDNILCLFSMRPPNFENAYQHGNGTQRILNYENKVSTYFIE